MVVDKKTYTIIKFQSKYLNDRGNLETYKPKHNMKTKLRETECQDVQLIKLTQDGGTIYCVCEYDNKTSKELF